MRPFPPADSSAAPEAADAVIDTDDLELVLAMDMLVGEPQSIVPSSAPSAALMEPIQEHEQDLDSSQSAPAPAAAADAPPQQQAGSQLSARSAPPDVQE